MFKPQVLSLYGGCLPLPRLQRGALQRGALGRLSKGQTHHAYPHPVLSLPCRLWYGAGLGGSPDCCWSSPT